MKTVIWCAILSLIIPKASAQESVWEKWDKEIIEKANTASNTSYLSEEEKKVVFFMNLARLDGPLFAETLLSEYMETSQTEQTSYTRSLFRDLKKLDPLQPLSPREDLFKIASGHADKSGRTGHVGHQGFNDRFRPLLGNPYRKVGENCSYGFSDAIDIVITLLIDEGIQNVGHRENILKPQFNSVGVAIRDHKRYRYNCVIDFGGRNSSELNDVPY